jgi:hypothetical protein
MKLLGLDISKSSATGYLLSNDPGRISQLWKTAKREPFYHFNNVFTGYQTLAELQPDIVVMEPTGFHYAEFWRKACEQLDIVVQWVGHMEVRNFRASHKLPSKNDKSDAFALACYTWTHLGEPEYFLTFSSEAVRIREIGLQLETVNRILSPLINRTRQQLAHEFPEAALKESENRDGIAPLWRWLAKINGGSAYYDRLHNKSIARHLGIEITSFTRQFASQIAQLQTIELELEAELRSLISDARFEAYNRVFHQLGIGTRLRGLLLARIYPIERYRALNGEQQHWNVKGFKLMLGMGMVEYSSGDKTYFAAGGSELVRKHLWLWIITRIAPQKSRPRSAIAQELSNYFDELKQVHLTDSSLARLRIAKTMSKGVRIMFRELIKEIQRMSTIDTIET